MGSPSMLARRLLVSLMIAALALVATAAPAQAGLALNASHNVAGQANAVDIRLLEGGALYDVDVDTAVAKIVQLTEDQYELIGPLDWVIEYADMWLRFIVDQVRTGGMECVYDGSGPRNSLVCYCFTGTWDCDDTTVLKWECHASVGPLWHLQLGLICLPPRDANA